jgi:hypothetical protein
MEYFTPFMALEMLVESSEHVDGKAKLETSLATSVPKGSDIDEVDPGLDRLGQMSW